MESPLDYEDLPRSPQFEGHESPHPLTPRTSCSLERPSTVRNLYVSGIKAESLQTVYEEFQRVGQIKSFHFFPAEQYGFINMRDSEHASRARVLLDGNVIGGGTLDVRPARPSSHRGSSTYQSYHSPRNAEYDHDHRYGNRSRHYAYRHYYPERHRTPYRAHPN